MTQADQDIVFVDKPKVDPGDDRLGYASFAEHLAQSLCRMGSTEGTVVALYGSWGSGKTTLLNFVVHYLREKPEDKQPVIVKFNPWWFSGHEDLVRRFFSQLEAVFSKWKVKGDNLRKQIADLADIVSTVPVPGASGALALSKASRPRQRDVEELKSRAAETLRKRQRRVLIVIDDIDRLTSDEIRQLFRVIKAVADFPNVVYLLAFDKNVAISALEEAQSGYGMDYLSKIIQVPLELPLPDKASLRQLLFENLDRILSGPPGGLFDRTYWAKVYYEGIDHFIGTPRDVVRLANTLGITYPAVKGEVNPVDFIAIETLRVSCPPAYDAIRKNPEAFTGSSGSGGLLEPRAEDQGSLHEAWLSEVPEERREAVRRLIVHLFPKLEAVWGGASYGPQWESAWRRQLRVCSIEILPTYFRLAVPEGGVSDAEMKALLALVGDANAFGGKLLELADQRRPDGTTKVRGFLERLEDFTETGIPLDAIPAVLSAFFHVGDGLLRPEDEPRGMFEFGNDIQIGRVMWRLLHRIDDEAERARYLREAILNGSALSTIVHEVAMLGQQHGKYGAGVGRPSDERFVNSEHLEELESLALEKVRRAVKEGALIRTPGLLGILYRWKDWGREEEPKEWVWRVAEDDQGLIELLEAFLARAFADGRGFHRLDPEQIEPFLEAAEIIDRVRLLSERADLSEKQETALRQFVKEYEIRQRGQDPDSPSSWMAE